MLKAFSLTNGLLSTTPVSKGTFTFAFPGGAPVVSANGSTNGIVWVLNHTSTNSGALHAYNANNLSSELYNSDQVSTRDALSSVVKFTEPLVVNGKVYVANKTAIVVYGLLH